MEAIAAQTEPELVVSIINFRTGDMTINCIRSVLDDLGGIDAKVIVVDNLSNDGSADQIADWIETQQLGASVTLVRSATNSGFAGGHNQAINAVRAKYYLILNSDAEIRPGFFAALLQSARAAPENGLFAPHIEYSDGPQQVSCFRFHSPASELIRGAGTGAVTKLFKRYDVPLEMPPQDGEIDWASFACILVDRRVIDDVGPLDEGYFLYYEDSDYCWRARQKGWRIAYVDHARVVHFRGGSGPVKTLAAARKRLPGYYYASRTRFLYRAYGWWGLIAANLLWYLGRGIAQARRLAGKPVPARNEREAADIWINVLSPYGDRRIG